MLGVEAHVLTHEREFSHNSFERAVAALIPIASREHAREHVMDKRKEKVNEKMKEPVFIGGIPLIDLDDCDVTNNELQCDSSDLDNNIRPNPDGIGICDGPRSCLQPMDSNVESTSRLVALEVRKHFEPHTMPIASIDDPLFNAAGKVLHPNAMVVKQEVGWFQLRAEKRQRKTAEKLAA